MGLPRSVSQPPSPRADAATISPVTPVKGRQLAAASASVLALWLLAVLLVMPRQQEQLLPSDASLGGDIEGERTAASRPAASAAVANTAGVGIPARPSEASPVPSLQQRLQRSSLRGSTVDGRLQLGPDGRLRMDAELVRFFEYHLALLGEFELGDIRALLAEHVQKSLGSAAVPSVLAAFERYLGLRQALGALPPGLSLQDTLRERVSLERQWFGEDAEAMFGEERAHDARTAARLEVSGGVPEGVDRPAPAAAQERDARSALLAEEQTRQFDALGLSQTERQSERTALWGAAAAARLDALDAERAAWEARLDSYADERDRLRDEGAASATDLEALRQRNFDALERMRVEALERAGAL
jgi:lipase chaperone LimK